MVDRNQPTEAQIRNIKRGLNGWFFAESTQHGSCNAAEQNGWLEGKSQLHSSVPQGDQIITRYKRAYKATEEGKKLVGSKE